MEKFEFLQEEQNLDHTLKVLNEEILNYIQKRKDVADYILEYRKKFIEFTRNIWILDVTEDEVGSKINYILGKTFELDRLYSEIKTKYDVLYKELNIENNSKIMLVVAGILVVSLVFNILNYVQLIK